MFRRVSLIILTVLLTARAQAQGPGFPQSLHEFDLRGMAYAPVLLNDTVFNPELSADASSSIVAPDGKTSVHFLGKLRNEQVPVTGLKIDLTTCTDRTLHATAHFELSSPLYSVTTPNLGEPYTFTASIPCGATTTFEFESDSISGQAITIWLTAEKVGTKLAETVALDFWKHPIEFRFPSDGDFYWTNQVHITHGNEWDIVTHEMGHALYEQAGLGQLSDGPHLIDRCHSSQMALSEGWATFFAGFVHFDVDDGDPKFEFLTPRRAPIHLENVPTDVCRGQTNEWRTAAFFWDLIDHHDDGERSEFSFKRIWDALLDSHSAHITQVVKILQGEMSPSEAAELTRAARAAF